MAVVTLTYTGSDEEIVSGIPRTMTIETNIPATIYFTLDGSTPTTNSPIYTDTFNMPDGQNSVTLSAFGVGGDGASGPILTQTFAPDISRIDIARVVGSEGFVLARADTGDNTPDGFLADGSTARFIDVDLETLDIIRDDRGYLGVAEGTEIEVNIPNPSTTSSKHDDPYVPHTTTEVAEFFDPDARVISIDNRLNNELNPILRPNGAIHDVYKEFGGKRIREPADDATYMSGGFVRRFYDARNNIMFSTYFDHNESRWIRNIQELPADTVVINSSNMYQQPIVFEWIYRGRQSSY